MLLYGSRVRHAIVRTACALILSVCSVCLPRATRADSAQETALARALFEEGVTLADAGDWEGAVDRFSRAYALKPSSGAAFNLASAELQLGRLVEASEHLRQVSRDAAATAELRAQADEKLAEVGPRIAALTIRVSGDTAGSQVSLDGRSVPKEALAVAMPVDPGAHEVTLTQGDRTLTSQTLELRDGERREVLLTAAPTLPPPGPGAPLVDPPVGDPGPKDEGGERADRTPLYKSWILWSAVGAVIAGGVVAGVLLSAGETSKQEPAVMGNVGSGVVEWK